MQAADNWQKRKKEKKKVFGYRTAYFMGLMTQSMDSWLNRQLPPVLWSGTGMGNWTTPLHGYTYLVQCDVFLCVVGQNGKKNSIPHIRTITFR